MKRRKGDRSGGDAERGKGIEGSLGGGEERRRKREKKRRERGPGREDEGIRERKRRRGRVGGE